MIKTKTFVINKFSPRYKNQKLCMLNEVVFKGNSCNECQE